MKESFCFHSYVCLLPLDGLAHRQISTLKLCIFMANSAV